MAISDSADSISFAVIGNATGRNPYCRTYLRQRDFSKARAVWYTGGTGIAKKLIREHGLVVLSEMPGSAYLADQVLQVPNFISLAIKLPADLSAYRREISTSMRSNIRLLENKGFSFQIIKESSWISDFYHHYYRPTTVKSHGDEAYANTESILRQRFQEPGMECLQIFEGDSCVGAVLCHHKDHGYHLISIGWRNGDEVLKKRGVPSAIYWYSICRAYDLGCKLVNLGGSPPYLENGVTRFKMPWGATFCKELTNYGYRDLLLNPGNPQCYRFLEDNSIIAYGEHKSLIVLSAKTPENCSLRDEFLKDIEAWYVLRAVESYDWAESSHVHLPLPLRPWYRSIKLPHKLKSPQLEATLIL